MKGDRFRAGKRLWSRKDIAALRKRYPHEPTAALARDLRRTVHAIYARADILGLRKSPQYLASPDAYRFRRGYHKGWEHRFPKGHVPANKGLRRPGWSPGRMKETQFKKGELAGAAQAKWLPVGAEVVDSDGYRKRKVADRRDQPSRFNWKFVHVLVWEAAHGRVPAGHAIVFRNGDRSAIRLDNLECLSRRALMARNTVHNLPQPLAATIQLLGALHRQIRRRDGHEARHQRSA